MSNKLRHILVISMLLFAPTSAFASFSYNDVKQLPKLPGSVSELTYEQRHQWLQDQIKKQTSPVELYLLRREQAFNHFNHKQIQTGIRTCKEVEPLTDDFHFREVCIKYVYPEYEEFIPRSLQLVHDAKQNNDVLSAVRVLMNIAWRQSNFGDIAGSYASYETALSIAPADDSPLLTTIMLDTASNYIVHGNDKYIQKGIQLLQRVREDNVKALKTATDDNYIAWHKENIQLADYNTGISYLLHLQQYNKALIYLDKVNSSENKFIIGSLVFSAYAAAKSKQFDRSKNYMVQLGGRKKNNPVADRYLSCYLELS
ncbi:hypothetical protein [Thalassotalea piscium]|uniref:Tetratricopeptide (TPR) repeat protein n=2 Tax=Thalassotalea piscium TaxID=1230533 RepID=A0A7X0NDT8_9GAMM|nr:hypothetical protein [Thalassotalea piscium]MBB6541609.1 tetratricopeptide (TPR) repeat protein [Thalassotalea piscium]